jgi:hypothetical protein
MFAGREVVEVERCGVVRDHAVDDGNARTQRARAFGSRINDPDRRFRSALTTTGCGGH